MRLRSFTAADMPSAIKMVRSALGEGAIILSSETLHDRRISVTAAVEEEEEAPPSPAVKHVVKAPPARSHRSDEALDALRHDIQNILRFHNLPELFIAKIMQKATDSDLSDISGLHRMSKIQDDSQLHRLMLEKLLTSFFAFKPLPLDAKTRIMLVGAPGIGKTLTVAKIAARLVMDHPAAKKEMTVITTDNKRAGGIEQLKAFTDILGVRLRVADDMAQLRGFMGEISAKAPVLIDTAGCNPYDEGELSELKTYASVPSIEPVLAMQAGGDSMEAIDMVEAFSGLPIRRLLMTRADTARRFGGVLAGAAAHQLALCNASSSSSIIDALEPLDGSALARHLLRYQLQSQ